MTRELEALKTMDSIGTSMVVGVELDEPCFICSGIDHLRNGCPTYSEMRRAMEDFSALGMLRKPYSPYFDTFNPRWRNYPNLSWKADTINLPKLITKGS